ILVGLLVFIDSNADKIVSHPFDQGRLVFDGFRNGIEPSVVDPTMSGGSARSSDELLDHELAVLILQIKQVLSPHRRGDPVGNAKTGQFGDKGVEVTVGKPGSLLLMARKVASAPSFLNFCCTRLTIAVASSRVPNSAAQAGIATITEANKAAENATARDIRFLPTGFSDAPVRSQGTGGRCYSLCRHAKVDNECGNFPVENNDSKFCSTDCNHN